MQEYQNITYEVKLNRKNLEEEKKYTPEIAYKTMLGFHDQEGWKLYSSKLLNEIDKINNAIISERDPDTQIKLDHDDLQKMKGMILGISMALALPQNIIRKHETIHKIKEKVESDDRLSGAIKYIKEVANAE